MPGRGHIPASAFRKLVAAHDFDDFLIGLLHAFGNHCAEIVDGFFHVSGHNALSGDTMTGQGEEAAFVGGLSGRVHFHRAGGFSAVTNHAGCIADHVIDGHAALLIGAVIKIHKRHGHS